MTDRLSIVAQAICNSNLRPIAGGHCDGPECSCWPSYVEDAEAAIAAHEKALKAEGLVIVPVEPTIAMVKAGDAKPTIMATLSGDCSDGLGVWKAMLAALEMKDAD